MDHLGNICECMLLAIAVHMLSLKIELAHLHPSLSNKLYHKHDWHAHNFGGHCDQCWLSQVAQSAAARFSMDGSFARCWVGLFPEANRFGFVGSMVRPNAAQALKVGDLDIGGVFFQVGTPTCWLALLVSLKNHQSWGYAWFLQKNDKVRKRSSRTTTSGSFVLGSRALFYRHAGESCLDYRAVQKPGG